MHTKKINRTLQSWQNMMTEFWRQVRSTNKATMRDWDVWAPAMNFYHAVRIGDTLVAPRVDDEYPFSGWYIAEQQRFRALTKVKNANAKQKLSNQLWTIEMDDKGVVIEKHLTQKGHVYNCQIGKTVKIQLTPEDLFDGDAFIAKDMIGLKLIEALDLPKHNVRYATSNIIRMDDLSEIEFCRTPQIDQVMKTLWQNERVDTPITLCFAISKNSAGGALIREF